MTNYTVNISHIFENGYMWVVWKGRERMCLCATEDKANKIAATLARMDAILDERRSNDAADTI